MCGGGKKAKKPVDSRSTNFPSASEHRANLNPNMYPTVPPRQHGQGCVIELALLEKHSDHCKHKKMESAERHPVDDKIGSYYVVGRVTYEMCARPCGGLKSNMKGGGGKKVVSAGSGGGGGRSVVSYSTGNENAGSQNRYPNCPCPNPPVYMYNAMQETLGQKFNEIDTSRNREKSPRSHRKNNIL